MDPGGSLWAKGTCHSGYPQPQKYLCRWPQGRSLGLREPHPRPILPGIPGQEGICLGGGMDRVRVGRMG